LQRKSPLRVLRQRADFLKVLLDQTINRTPADALCA
jgi:hypothetical protein